MTQFSSTIESPFQPDLNCVNSTMAVSTERVTNIPPFPRPASLIIPNEHFALPIVDTSSYSPFPTFPGSKHARDPYGLNSFLLHPAESDWKSDPLTLPGSDGVQTMDEGVRKSTRALTISKRRSVSMFRRPSPLSQPPVGPDHDTELVSSPGLRKRSNSVDSASTASIQLEDDFLASLPENKSKSPLSLKSKTFRKALGFGKKQSPIDIDPTPPSSLTTEIIEALDLAPPSILAETLPTTPMTSRTSSNFSAISSDSSASSDGVQTPHEIVPLDISLAGVKLADALLEVELKANDRSGRKSWMGWLGGRRGSKVSVNSGTSSGASTPVGSNGPSPSTSSTDLVSMHRTLSPSPAISSPAKSTLSLRSIPEEPSPPWVAEKLRRMSIQKLNHIREPSPHPFARSLRRQHFNLTDELALSLQAGKRVFPASINPYQPDILIHPTTGLWHGMAIRRVLSSLEKGVKPTGLLSNRHQAATLTKGRFQPRGIADFINRLPFEERMLVFFPGDIFSPISMARPGYGVWDLDFSDYILALREVDEQSASRTSLSNSLSAPNLASAVSVDTSSAQLRPIRGSVGGLDEFEGLIGIIDGLDSDSVIQPDVEQEEIEVLASSLGAESSSTAGTLDPDAGSSFKRKTVIQTWDDSDEEQEDEDEDEDEDKPLAMVIKKSSNSTPSSDLRAPVRPQSTHVRSRSTSSQTTPVENESAKARVMAKVVQARQRQEQARTGQTERLAMADQIRSKQEARVRTRSEDARPALKGKSKSASTTDLPARSQSQPRLKLDTMVSSSDANEGRPSSVVVSSASPGVLDTAHTRRSIAARSGTDRTKKYHSFYEAQTHSQPNSSHTSPISPMAPLPMAPYGARPQSYIQPFPHPQAYGYNGFPFPQMPMALGQMPMHMGMPAMQMNMGYMGAGTGQMYVLGQGQGQMQLQTRGMVYDSQGRGTRMA